MPTEKTNLNPLVSPRKEKTNFLLARVRDKHKGMSMYHVHHQLVEIHTHQCHKWHISEKKGILELIALSTIGMSSINIE
mgnify:CR=1 FL=1